ncbi:hypothetical protein [Photobacterium ganghwense]|uniref:hypothetical protein n=1 Tax=Photobacterium ganghwense TaxID=320778 RepID=UPI0011B21E54|nr:hypothetical protein [Photobacterium ganghwense]
MTCLYVQVLSVRGACSEVVLGSGAIDKPRNKQSVLPLGMSAGCPADDWLRSVVLNPRVLCHACTMS